MVRLQVNTLQRYKTQRSIRLGCRKLGSSAGELRQCCMHDAGAWAGRRWMGLAWAMALLGHPAQAVARVDQTRNDTEPASLAATSFNDTPWTLRTWPFERLDARSGVVESVACESHEHLWHSIRFNIIYIMRTFIYALTVGAMQLQALNCCT